MKEPWTSKSDKQLVFFAAVDNNNMNVKRKTATTTTTVLGAVQSFNIKFV